MKRHVGFCWLAIVALGAGMCASPSLGANPFRFKKPADKPKSKLHDEEDDLNEFATKAKVPLVGEFTQVVGQNMIVLQGAGLVTGLDGTGENPPPSPHRQAVLEEMKRRGVKNPNEILKSPNTAIVIITAYLPPLIREGEHFDVEVRVPDGSKVKSLNGGWLMETYLAEHAIVPGRGVLKGEEMATAKGPILVSAASEHEGDLAGILRRGRIVAGGTSKKTRNLDLYLRNDFRSERNAIRIANAIGRRFFEFDSRGQQVPLADPKTDQRIELKVLSKYRDNYPRYLEVIRKIAFRETEVGRHVRIRGLKEELFNPDTAYTASIMLEAIGEKGIPILKSGVQSAVPEVRFHSAVALAYLGDASGLDSLARAARDEYAFRIYALAAMACVEDAEAHLKLRELMDADSAETRYGAFRALTTLDRNDPFVRGRLLNDQFRLHVLATSGPPMVHLTNRKKTEVVIFGGEQRVRTPVTARAGARILVTGSAGSQKVTVARYELGRDDEKRIVSNRLEDIILAIAELGATFPDVASFLTEVNSQKNLAGRLEIDSLPKAGRFYDRSNSVAGRSSRTKKRVGDPNTAPNLFAIDEELSSAKRSQDDANREAEARTASGDLAREDAGKPKSDSKKSASRDPAPQRKPRAESSDPDEDDSNASSVRTASATDADDPDGPPSPKDKKTDGSTSPSTSPSAPSKAVKQAGFEQRVGAKSKGAAETKSKAAADDSDELDPPKPHPTRRFSLLRIFEFGDRGLSGNKEP